MAEKKDFIEKVAEAPAEALESAIEVTVDAEINLKKQKPIKKLKAYWRILGPGLTTGAADDDCSGIATYSQQGAKYGYSLLWLAPLTFPLMAGVQEMCARLGLVTGKGLASNIKTHFPRSILYIATLLLVVANVFNIGADIGAMAEAMRLLTPNVSFTLLAIMMALLSLGLQIFTGYKTYAKYLKWLSFVLFAYVIAAFLPSVHLDWLMTSHGLLSPTIDLSKDQIILICAILGTTISPYLFFWQTSQEVEEEGLLGKIKAKFPSHTAVDHRIKRMKIDVWSGMLYSNLIMFFIVAVCAAVLNGKGVMNITTAADAANSLRPVAGDYAYLLFAVGIIGIGLLAIPVLAGSISYALSETFGWKEGLNYELKEASAFYGVLIIAIILGLLMNFVGLDPIKSLIWAAVANGLAAPLLLVLIVILSSNKKIMGGQVNGTWAKILGWLCVGIMVTAGGATIYSFF